MIDKKFRREESTPLPIHYFDFSKQYVKKGEEEFDNDSFAEVIDEINRKEKHIS